MTRKELQILLLFPQPFVYQAAVAVVDLQAAAAGADVATLWSRRLEDQVLQLVLLVIY